MPSPKHEDLQRKVCRWMGRAQSPSNLQTPVFVVEGYYSGDSSSPSLKQVVQSETEVESSKTVVMPVMTIGINISEEEMVAMDAMLEKLIEDIRFRIGGE